MKKLESLKKSTFDSFKDYQMNNLVSCKGGRLQSTNYHDSNGHYGTDTWDDVKKIFTELT